MGWGDGAAHWRLIFDLMKYSPADFLHLFDATSCKKERLEYLISHGTAFLDAPATLEGAIAIVKFERRLLLHAETSDEEIEFGIIDFPDSTGPSYYDLHRYAHDASLDGTYPDRHAVDG
jgi:hypothetical protein